MFNAKKLIRFLFSVMFTNFYFLSRINLPYSYPKGYRATLVSPAPSLFYLNIYKGGYFGTVHGAIDISMYFGSAVTDF